tara:strand:+ start:93 stop:290 length:198 start_codon:yes stop_codon:yes gene_type:complete
MKFKSVSIREDNLKEIDTLSKSLLPKVNLSKAQTIAKVLDIAKSSLGKSKINQENNAKKTENHQP